MAAGPEEYTLGVEEEYILVDAETRELAPLAERVIEGARGGLGEGAHTELRLSQVEVATPVCRTLAEVRSELGRSRGTLLRAAAPHGGAIVAASTHPFSRWAAQPFAPQERYQSLAREYLQLAREQVINGCHVHVGLADRDLAVHVLNRVRAWLAPLLALSTSSPFWQGEDTGYASWRTLLWGRWPTSGPPQLFRDRGEYDALVRSMVAAGAIGDASRLYWDARLPARLPTVELRVMDACSTVDEAVMVAGLARALVRTAHEGALEGRPYPAPRQEVLRAAHWRAARYGLDGTLVDPGAERQVPAAELIEKLLGRLRPALEAGGDWEEVSRLVRRTLEGGNSAARQRRVLERTGSLTAVVDALLEETAAGAKAPPAHEA